LVVLDSDQDREAFQSPQIQTEIEKPLDHLRFISR